MDKLLKELESRIEANNITSIAQVVHFIYMKADISLMPTKLYAQMNAYHLAFNFEDKKADYMKGLYLYLARENLKG